MGSALWALLAALLLGVEGGDVAAWKQRTIYQVLTDRFWRTDGSTGGCSNLQNYCGGTWAGLTSKLDYIQGMGFDAIWISPVVDNIEGGYHGYWAANWEKLNSNFGTADDLKRLVSEAHSRGMWVMVDVVANHVGPVGDDFSRIYPLNRQEHYHSDCDIKDWSNQWQVENCRLAGLPDINQENTWVRGYLKDWVKNLVGNYSFDGIRIDTVPEVEQQFWSEYGEASGVYQLGEVFNGDPSYVGPYQKYLTGVFNYPMYYTIRDVWEHGKSMRGITGRYQEEGSTFIDLSALGVFVDNHDNARFLNGNNNQQLFKGALTFSLLSTGIPVVYYGDEQGFGGGNDPNNRETLWTNLNPESDLYKYLATVITARKQYRVWEQQQVERWADDTFYAFSRGNFLVALTNQVSSQNRDITYLPFSEGTTVCNVFYPTTDCQTVSGGKLSVYLENGEAKIYVPKQ
eukprot:Sspe_Gene.15400::Locus_5356_Transcript_1_1_Confidence_1.000_Length_1450::g.15400::m.15400/K01176/AMY, amyA, malS; alpha-amylase